MARVWHKHFTGAALLLLAVSCGTGHEESRLQSGPSTPWSEAAIDSTLLEVRMFKLIGDTSPAFSELPKSGFPLVMLSQGQGDQRSIIGFAVSCKGRDPLAVARSFGEVFLDTADIESISEADLDALYKVSEQPFLRCDALNGQNQVSPLFSQLYRVIDSSQKKSHILARFNTYSPLDKKLFDVGCQNILTNFKDPTRTAIPVFIENLTDIPGGDKVGALHCFDTADPIPQDLTVPAASPRVPPFDARLYQVQDDETSVSRVLLTGGRAFRLDCQAPDSSLQSAFGLPVTGALEELHPSNPVFDEYLSGKIEEQPVLRCETPSHPQFASDAYQIVNQSEQKVPLLRLKDQENTLVQFSCESAARFFGKTIMDSVQADPTQLKKITDQSIDVLARSYVPGQLQTKFYNLGCAASNVTQSDISRLYHDVYGTDITQELLTKTEQQCRSQGSACNAPSIEQAFVEALRQSPTDITRVISSSFRATQNREPSAEELTYFTARFSNGSLRPHSVELQTFLKTAKFLDRNLFIQATRAAFGVDTQDDLLQQWTTRQFNEPTLVITAASLKTEFEALIKKSYLDVVIKRVYQTTYAFTAKDFQIAALKKQVTGGTLGASFTTIQASLQKLTSECVTVASNKNQQPFTFMRPRTKVTITGTWTAIADGKDKVGPAGSKEKYTPNDWTVNSLNLSRLLIAQKNSSNAWGAWVGWTSSMTFNKIVEINMIINDKKNAYGDNSGSLKACFE